jgi:hypothetical protein
VQATYPSELGAEMEGIGYCFVHSLNEDNALELWVHVLE